MTQKNKKKHIAHVRPNTKSEADVHDLAEHLRDVAKGSKQFAVAFGAADWARLAGLWHDLGKYRPAFQKHIRKSSGYDTEAHITGEYNSATRHASTGAVYAMKKLDRPGLILAYLIAGHHAGLPDYDGDEASGFSLCEILKDDKPLLKEALNEPIPEDILESSTPESLSLNSPKDLHFLIRMLFSCLVDADFLDTEKFMSPEKASNRRASKPPAELLGPFNQYIDGLQNKPKTELNKLRSEILTTCRQKAQDKPGVFTMTVPTGGGKTLSSMAFALKHAIKYKKHRVIYAIPYTSIIEQTADVFRKVFKTLGEEILIEHHSNIEPKDEKDEKSWSRLATENWDAPLVITTTVQLFESIYAARTSRCRKLHNLVNSVIVLDEVQLLPAENLEPIRRSIKVLSERYGVTFVLTTATPTGLSEIQNPFGKELLQGIESEEIIEDVSPYYKKLQRVTYELPDVFNECKSWDEIAGELERQETALAVVNTRKDAKELFNRLPQDNAYHLSARMCAEHRSKVIGEIKERLEKRQPVRLVSTQLIEAGVDLDFPVVYRALAGLDSIAQAAGRCNREGKLKNNEGKLAKGRVVVFVPSGSSPPGALSQAIQVTKSLVSGKDNKNQLPHSPETFIQYFKSLYQEISNHDIKDVLDKLHRNAGECRIQFRTAAKRFRMIQIDDMVSIFVDYNEQAKEHIRRLRSVPEKNGWLLKKLQRYTVNVYQYEFQKMRNEGRVEEIIPESGFFAISGGGVYSDKLGLLVEEAELHLTDTVI